MAAKDTQLSKKTVRKRASTSSNSKKTSKKSTRRKVASKSKVQKKSDAKAASRKKTTNKNATTKKKAAEAKRSKEKLTQKKIHPKRKKAPQKKKSSTVKKSQTTIQESPGKEKEKRNTPKKPSVSIATSGRTKPVSTTSGESVPSPMKRQQVVILQADQDKFTLLDNVLAKSGFWFTLDEARFLSGEDGDLFQILIKPDFNACELTGSTATDPELVEHLIDELHDRGYTQVVVAESRNSFDLWLENRDVQILADMLGYQYVTPAGWSYDVIDLADELVPGPFGAGSILQGSEISQRWINADFTILFSKNKTDDENAYYLCLDNLISLLPLRDKDYHYKQRLNQHEVLLELLQNVRVDFSIIDAYVSNHGNAGSRVARPIETHTFIAGQQLLLTDHAAALKMGIDPCASQNYLHAVNTIGLPKPHHIDGDLTPYPNWINVQPLVLESVQKRQLWPGLNQILTPWLQMVDSECFPFKDPVNEQINHKVSHYLANIDDNPTVFWSLIIANHILGFIYQSMEAWQIMYAKDRLLHKEVALNINLDDYTLKDFESTVDYLEPLEQETRSLHADTNGLRWTYHTDGSVLFEFSRIIPVDYDDFVKHVDIRKSIQYMNDYIGGLIIPVQKDQQERVTHQVERNLYLPQPNYLVLYQGKNIDVSKLEWIRYRNDEQKMYWKTVKSENGSASYDDGTVSFIRQDNGDTLVSVFGRQQFTLPLFWQLVNLDNYPALKKILYTHAYTTFFTTTMANFEAVYDGRDVRIGRAWHPQAGEPGSEQDITSPSDQMLSLLTGLQDFIQRNIPEKEDLLTRFITPYNPQPEHVDEDGFSHFKPGLETEPSKSSSEQAEASELQSLFTSSKTFAADFWKDLYQAILRDNGLFRG